MKLSATFLLIAIFAALFSSATAAFGKKKQEAEVDGNGAAYMDAAMKGMAQAMQDPGALTEIMKMAQDPEVMKEVKKMMDDPSFQNEIKKMTNAPEFKQYLDQAQDMLKDPKVMQDAQKKFEQYQDLMQAAGKGGKYTAEDSAKLGLGQLSGMANPAELAKAMDALSDPAVAAEVQKLMDDPSFKAEIDKYLNHPEAKKQMDMIQNQMKDIAQDPQKMAELRKEADRYVDQMQAQQAGAKKGAGAVNQGMAGLAKMASDPMAIAGLLEDLNDPSIAQEVEQLMNDPEFKRQMDAMTQSNLFKEAMVTIQEEMKDIAGDPRKMADLREEAERMVQGQFAKA